MPMVFPFFLFQSDAFGVDSGNLPAPKVWSQQNLLCSCEKARERRNICHCDDIQVTLFLLMISSSSTQSLQVKTWIILEINISSTCRELLPNSTQAHFSSLSPSFIQLFPIFIYIYLSILPLVFCYVAALWPWRRWTVVVLVTQRSLVIVLVMSKRSLAEIWTSTVWLVVLVKAVLGALTLYYYCWPFFFYQTLSSHFPCFGCSSQVIWVALGAGKNKICNVFASVSWRESLVELG